MNKKKVSYKIILKLKRIYLWPVIFHLLIKLRNKEFSGWSPLKFGDTMPYAHAQILYQLLCICSYIHVLVHAYNVHEGYRIVT